MPSVTNFADDYSTVDTLMEHHGFAGLQLLIAKNCHDRANALATHPRDGTLAASWERKAKLASEAARKSKWGGKRT